jgi:transcription initiation factor IIE alpha subunit
MTRSCCPSCRLRFTRAAAAVLVACPSCGEGLHEVDNVAQLVGYRLATDAPEAQVMAEALAVSLRSPSDPTT